MKWLKLVSFQLILPGSSWPQAARHAQCWPCPAPHSWKTLGGSCQPWVLPACPCKHGCPALFLTNGVHPATAQLLSLSDTQNPFWSEYIPHPGARGGFNACPEVAQLCPGLLLLGQGVLRRWGQPLGISPSSWEDKEFQGFKLGSWLCASPALLCGQGAQVWPLLCWAVAGLALLTCPGTWLCTPGLTLLLPGGLSLFWEENKGHKMLCLQHFMLVS